MTDLELDRWAELLTDYCLNVSPSEVIAIQADLDALPLVEACYLSILDRGAYPVTRIILPGFAEHFVSRASEEILGYLPPLDLMEAKAIDGRIRIVGERDPTGMSQVDPTRQAIRAKAAQPLRLEAMKRKWVLTQFPTPAYAKLAEQSMEEYGRFVSRALFLDQDSPSNAWKALGQRQQRFVEYMSRVHRIRIEGPETDLTLSVRGRTWINSDGRRNMPSGEIFTGPWEDSAQGTIYCSFPVCRGGRSVEGIRLEFKDGIVVRSSAESSESYLNSMLDLDSGARRVGELGLGLNPGIDRFTGSILFDEKIGGTVHVAIGQSYPETRGSNQSALHWDLIVDLRSEGRIYADDQLIMEHGNWRIES